MMAWSKYILILLICGAIPVGTFAQKPDTEADARVQSAQYPIHSIAGLRAACEEVVKEQAGREYDPRGYGICYGYIKGVKDSYDLVSRAQGTGNICFAYNSSYWDLIQSVVRWSLNNPDMDDMIAWTGVVTAWSGDYGCDE